MLIDLVQIICLRIFGIVGNCLSKQTSNVALNHHVISIETKEVEVLRLTLRVKLDWKSVDLIHKPISELGVCVSQTVLEALGLRVRGSLREFLHALLDVLGACRERPSEVFVLALYGEGVSN